MDCTRVSGTGSLFVIPGKLKYSNMFEIWRCPNETNASWNQKGWCYNIYMYADNVSGVYLYKNASSSFADYVPFRKLLFRKLTK